MHDVGQALVVRVGVHGGEHALLDAERLVEDLCHGCQAIRGARCIRDDAVLVEVEGIVIDSQDDRHVGISHRCGHDDILGSGGEVLGRCRVRAEHTGRLDHDIDTEFTPRELFRIALREDLESVAVHDDVTVDDLDGPRVGAVHGVVLEEMGIHRDISEVVDCDDVDPFE